MIQRVQSLWLFLAALANSGVLLFDLYRAHIVVNGSDTLMSLRVNDKFHFLLMALVIIILPLVAIFMFKNRKRQRTLSVLSIIFSLSFVSTMIFRVSKFSNEHPEATNGSYWIGSVLPVAAIVFLFLAIRGIAKDERLIRSQDRLR
jgi:uncharacterized membrane protein